MDNRNRNPRSTGERRPRHDDAWAFRWLDVGGVTLVPQGFARHEEDVDLLAQCAELNRAAILPPPELLAGKSVKEIAAGVRW